MIFQDPIASLNPRMTVREIIGEGLRINGEKNKSVLNEKVCAMLKKVGLDKGYADRYPHEFSGGQRQRIGIARALIMQPKLIIADEPVSALDVSVQAQVINLLNDLRREFGLTVLFIAHDLSVVKYFSDRIAVMYQGKIVEQASSDELFKRPLHGYTRSLLSAIPIPDPLSERQRKRLLYEPETAQVDEESPSFQEIFSGHFVLCGQREAEKLKKQKRSRVKNTEKEKKVSEQKGK
jgi:oligopeptide transport system ATP-binding protein